MGALLASFLAASPAYGSIVQALDLDDLVEQSDQILLGRVVFSESFQRANGTLGTWHRIVIERDVRGSASGEQEVIVETLGGQLGDIGMRVEGEPSFSVGERVVVFVRGDGGYAAFRPVGYGPRRHARPDGRRRRDREANPRGDDVDAAQCEGPPRTKRWCPAEEGASRHVSFEGALDRRTEGE